jgi:hypothetical protein
VRREAFGGVRFYGDLRPPRSQTRGKVAGGLVLFAVAAVVVSLIFGRHDESAPSGAGESSAIPSTPVDSDPDGRTQLRVCRASFAEKGRTWPLTVDGGTLACEPFSSVLFTAYAGGTDAVNGTAMAPASWPDIDEVEADAPDGSGPKVNIGHPIETGFGLCRDARRRRGRGHSAGRSRSVWLERPAGAERADRI